MIRRVASHPTAANLLMMALVVMGAVMAATLPREEMPAPDPVLVQVRGIFLGATPEEVEESICRPIEEALDTVPNIKSVTAEALDSMGVVTVERDGQGDLSAFAMEVDSVVAAITGLPAGAEELVVTQLNPDEAVITVLVGGPSSATELHAYSEDLAARLRRLVNVSSVEVSGFADRQLRAELNADQLMRFSLSVQDVADAIADESVDRPAGRVYALDREKTLRFTERRRTADELEELVIRESPSGTIRLRDVGQVRDLFEVPEDRVEVQGERVGRIEVRKSRSSDAVEVADQVREFVERERAEMSEGVELWLTNDNSSGFSNQLAVVAKSGWQGMLLVFVALWLFFTGRLALWVVLSLPVSFLGALTFFPIFGLTLNIVSLVGMLMATG
ncbi:MAG: efflux RND transporter permease subunit, partial [Planctomycetota bacterium]